MRLRADCARGRRDAGGNGDGDGEVAVLPFTGIDPAPGLLLGLGLLLVGVTLLQM